MYNMYECAYTFIQAIVKIPTAEFTCGYLIDQVINFHLNINKILTRAYSQTVFNDSYIHTITHS